MNSIYNLIKKVIKNQLKYLIIINILSYIKVIEIYKKIEKIKYHDKIYLYYMERIVIANGYSLDKQKNLDVCFNKIISQCEMPKLIIYSSNNDDLWFYAKMIKEKFPDADSIGTSSYINFNSNEYNKNGLSIMAINYDIECSSNIIYEIDRHPNNYVTHINYALNKLSSLENCCCLEFSCSGSNGEDLVLETFDQTLKGKNITVFGSCSGALEENSTVAYNGDIFLNSCVFVFIKNLSGKINFFTDNIYKKTNLNLKTTDIDCDKRIVYEYNHKIAADLFCELLNVDLDSLEEALQNHPIGRQIQDNLFVIDANKINKDGSISYLAQIFNQNKYYILEKINYKEIWKDTKERIQKEVKKNSFGIVINCCGRTRLYENENNFNEFFETLKTICPNFIGFSGYGEQLENHHMNHAFIVAIFE